MPTRLWSATTLSMSARAAYIVNVGQSGFVILAGDNRITPILGYSTESRFETEGMPENLRYWLEGIREEIAYALNENILTETPKITYQWEHLAELAGTRTVIVDALVQTTWNQSKYYNQQCPADTAGPDGHVYTGCS